MLNRTAFRTLVTVVLCGAILLSASRTSSGAQDASAERFHSWWAFTWERSGEVLAMIGGTVPTNTGTPMRLFEPRWLPDGRGFWYSRPRGAGTELMVVDPAAGTQKPAVESEIAGWVKDKAEPGTGDAVRLASPDNKQFARRRGPDLWVDSGMADTERPITTNGSDTLQYLPVSWSPDGRWLLYRSVSIEGLPAVPLMRWLTRLPEPYTFRRHSRPDSGVREYRGYVWDRTTGTSREIELPAGWYIPPASLRWHPDGTTVLFQKINREENHLVWARFDALSAMSRELAKETNPLLVRPKPLEIVDAGTRAITGCWPGGRSAPALCSLDLITGKLESITPADLLVRELVGMQEVLGWVYFMGHGWEAADPPGTDDLYRMRLDGTGLARLTDRRAHHRIELSPSGEFFLDTLSTPGSLPIVELRRADGTLVMEVARGRDAELRDRFGWRPPKPFEVNLDGDPFFGYVYLPHDFDPQSRYPVVLALWPLFGEGAAFDGNFRSEALADLGFVVVGFQGFAQNRSGWNRRLRDYERCASGEVVCTLKWHDARYETPYSSRVLTALARERPYMDLTRTGVVGYSAGGGPAILHLLQAPELFDVAVAGEPCYIDPYLTGGSGIAYRILRDRPDAYATYSAIGLVDRLQGHLLLIQPTADQSCQMVGVMRLIDALVQAGKPYDLILLPDDGHQLNRADKAEEERLLYYFREAYRRYLVAHLQQVAR